jgi:starch synthase
MRVLFVSAEVAPFAKVGGLADVAAGLPKALVKQGIECRVFLPAYQMIVDDPRWEIEPLIDAFEVHLNDHWTKTASLSKISYHGVTYYLVGTDEWYTKSVDSSTLYQPGGELHAFFAAAVFQSMEKIGWIPDVIHANDWHTGFIPLYLKERAGSKWRHTSCIFSIHNLAYQGEFGLESLDWLGFSHSLYNYREVEAWGRVNFLKTGMVFADAVNTVSPTYAQQIQTTEYGCGLEGLLQFLNDNGRLSGILNGIDQEEWNPDEDRFLDHHFSASNPQSKEECRNDLLRLAGLPQEKNALLIGMVTRLSSQKGFDLVMQAAPKLFELPVQFVIQGLGESHIIEGLKRLERDYPKNLKLIHAFDESSARKVYAGSDAFLMPSSFEPCGLGQMIAMRYGSIPIVRQTGGLKDTVQDGHNGFSFVNRTTAALIDAIERAFMKFENREEWENMRQACLSTDWSWDESATLYTKLYKKSLEVRKGLQMR